MTDFNYDQLGFMTFASGMFFGCLICYLLRLVDLVLDWFERKKKGDKKE